MSVKRVLVIGSNGLLGQKVAEILVRGSAYNITLASQEEKPVRPLLSAEYVPLDITVKKDVKRVVFSAEPDVIVNCAAFTDVDGCEAKRELAWKVNVGGVENLIEAARKDNVKVVHVSTDYIFDGKAGPYTEDDRPEPLSYYGKSKLASENALRASGIEYFIARTMVLYGFAPEVKSNFALWLIQNLEKAHPVRVVDDQYGNPTLVDDLAFGIASALELGRTGIYNIAGRDILSRYEFALQLARIFDFDAALITPIKTSQLRQPAPRPLKSGLLTLKAEVELGYKPSSVAHGLSILKGQLTRTLKHMGDSAPVPGSSSGRQGSAAGRKGTR
jgi:dTDP-4-dehydrorhamnose reductase